MKKENIQEFIDKLFELCRTSKGDAARLRHADVPALAPRSWGSLARLGVYPDNWDLPECSCVAAAVAGLKDYQNGTLGLGTALRLAYAEKRAAGDKEQADFKAPDGARLRRILSCDTVEELVRILRPMIKLIQSRGVGLDYARLLGNLSRFRFNPEAVKQQWATEFFRRGEKDNTADNTAQGEAK